MLVKTRHELAAREVQALISTALYQLVVEACRRSAAALWSLYIRHGHVVGFAGGTNTPTRRGQRHRAKKRVASSSIVANSLL